MGGSSGKIRRRKRAAPAGDPKVAVAYLRVSTDEQELGPDAQRHAIEAWAAREGVQIASWHEDHGISGTNPVDKRPALLAALEALRVNRAGVLVVQKRDRLARAVVVAAVAEKLAKERGAQIVAADGNGNGDSPEDALLRTMLDGFAQYEAAVIAARTKAALAVKRSKGEKTGGDVPYGYRVSAGKLLKDRREQNAIRMMQRLRSEKATYRAIGDALEFKGYETRRGGPWLPATVRRILVRAERE